MKISENTVFFNSDYVTTLIKDGVVKIPFLNAKELDVLLEFYTEIHKDNLTRKEFDGIHMTIWDSNWEYKMRIKEGIKKIIYDAFERNFKNYRTFGQQFIVKKQGNETTFPIHQDWSIVDEGQFFSLNIWVPLQNVNSTNGTMWVIKGSHKLDRKIRGAGVLFPDYSSFFEELRPYMTSFDMRAGEALIFYHSTVHGSPCNQDTKPRIVVQTSLLPENAPLQIYFQKSQNDPLEIHHPNDDFSAQYDNIREESAIQPPTQNPTKIIRNFKTNSNEYVDLLSLLNKL